MRAKIPMTANEANVVTPASAGPRVMKFRTLKVFIVVGAVGCCAALPDLPFWSATIAKAQLPVKDSVERPENSREIAPTSKTRPAVVTPTPTVASNAAATKRSGRVVQPALPAQAPIRNPVERRGNATDSEWQRRSRIADEFAPKAQAPVRNPIERSGNSTDAVAPPLVAKPGVAPSSEASARQAASDALRKLQRDRELAEGAKAPVKNPIERNVESNAVATPAPNTTPGPSTGPAPPNR